MSAPFIDLAGHRYGMLQVIERAANRGRRTMWMVQCDCGIRKVVGGAKMRARNIVSCGCWRADHPHKKLKVHTEQCNIAKNTLSVGEFTAWIDRLATHIRAA